MQNAMDSLEYAIDCLAYERELSAPTRQKRAILAVSQAIELLLKERLRRIHPSLVWENVDKYPNLEARTVTTEAALLRLKNIGGVSFTCEDENLLRSMRKTRNAIEHYSWTMSVEEAEFIVGSAVAFAGHFMKEQLGHDLLARAEREGGIISDLMHGNRFFAEAYKQRESFEYQQAHGNAGLCGFCKAVLQHEDDGVCPKCGHWSRSKYGAWVDDEDAPF